MNNTIDSLFNTVSGQILYPIYYGLVSVIAIIALIYLIIQCVSIVTSPQGSEQRTHIKAALIVLAVCLFAAFAPSLINWVISLAGATGKGAVGGVSFGG